MLCIQKGGGFAMLINKQRVGGNEMKTLIFSLLACLSFSASQAATILIDFEDVTPAYYPGPAVPPINMESKGFAFTASPNLSSYSEGSVGPGGLYVDAECAAWGPGCGANISMQAVNGSSFGILSIGSYSGDVYGGLAGGGTADLSTAIGTGDWLTLEYFSVNDTCYIVGYCSFHAASLDDITVSAVPIPAAVWLFGSALAGLGWLKRKKT